MRRRMVDRTRRRALSSAREHSEEMLGDRAPRQRDRIRPGDQTCPSTVSRIKVAYIVQRFPLASETFIVREMNALVACEGVDVTLMSLLPSKEGVVHEASGSWLRSLRRPAPREAAAAVGYWLARRPLCLLGSIIRISARAWRHPSSLVRSVTVFPIAAAHARVVHEEGIGRIHAHFAALPTVAAWLIGRLCRVPYSFTAHAYDIFVSQDLLTMKIADAEFVVAVSEYNRAFLHAFDRGQSTPLLLIHCGIDPQQYEYRPRSIPRTGPVRALCVAGLVEQKGHAVLLDALASCSHLDRVKVDLVGDGELRDELERRVRELGLLDRVRFLGLRSESQVQDLLESTDMFVLPSVIVPDGRMEGLPVALVEALACGVPVVSTRLSGIPELIADRRTGRLAEPGDPRSLAVAIRWLVDGGRLDLDAGRRLVEEEFDVYRSASRLAESFRAPHT